MGTLTEEFDINLGEVDALIRHALAKTYATKNRFDNESDFKFELYHQMHRLSLNHRKLGSKLPGCPTCPLHAESKPENGNPSKADLLICNPTIRNRFNYRAEVVVELKDNLNEASLRTELEKFSRYTDKSICRLYVIAANINKLTEVQQSQVLLAHQPDSNSLVVLDRSVVQADSVRPEGLDYEGRSLLDAVSECITATLKLYGNDRKQYHGFFWCNYEYEEGKGWTFPVEGDFNAQLYHRLRSQMPRGTTIQTEFNPGQAGRTRADIFIKSPSESVGVEVKMNWDQFKPKFKNGVENKTEALSILEKFNAMSAANANHSNILVVIQGEHAHKSTHKANALDSLLGGDTPFHLFYYDELQGREMAYKTNNPLS